MLGTTSLMKICFVSGRILSCPGKAHPPWLQSFLSTPAICLDSFVWMYSTSCTRVCSATLLRTSLHQHSFRKFYLTLAIITNLQCLRQKPGVLFRSGSMLRLWSFWTVELCQTFGLRLLGLTTILHREQIGLAHECLVEGSTGHEQSQRLSFFEPWPVFLSLHVCEQLQVQHRSKHIKPIQCTISVCETNSTV